MISLFVGFDERESVGFHVFQYSLLKHATKPVACTPLSNLGLAEGSNHFTYSRFMVPYLMGFRGHAIFADGSDMLMLGDITELAKHYDKSKAVQVVKHPDYQSTNARKYIGTEMECDQTNYPRKNWASVMIINCNHSAWFAMTPKFLETCDKLELLQLRYFDDAEIGELPPEWNVLVDEGQDDSSAKILHWTQGLPSFPHYRNSRRSKDWFDYHDALFKNG